MLLPGAIPLTTLYTTNSNKVQYWNTPYALTFTVQEEKYSYLSYNMLDHTGHILHECTAAELHAITSDALTFQDLYRLGGLSKYQFITTEKDYRKVFLRYIINEDNEYILRTAVIDLNVCSANFSCVLPGLSKAQYLCIYIQGDLVSTTGVGLIWASTFNEAFSETPYIQSYDGKYKVNAVLQDFDGLQYICFDCIVPEDISRKISATNPLLLMVPSNSKYFTQLGYPFTSRASTYGPNSYFKSYVYIDAYNEILKNPLTASQQSAFQYKSNMGAFTDDAYAQSRFYHSNKLSSFDLFRETSKSTKPWDLGSLPVGFLHSREAVRSSNTEQRICFKMISALICQSSSMHIPRDREVRTEEQFFSLLREHVSADSQLSFPYIQIG